MTRVFHTLRLSLSSPPPPPTSSSLRASFHPRPTVTGPGLGSGGLTHGSGFSGNRAHHLPCLTWKWKSLFTELVEEASCMKLVSPAGLGGSSKDCKSRVPRGGLGGQLTLAPPCLPAAVPLISRETVFLVSMCSWRCFNISYLLTTAWLCDYGPAWSLSLHAMSLLCAVLQSSELQEAPYRAAIAVWLSSQG